MVQKGASNDEWEAFCHAEKCSQQQDSNLWKDWTNSSEDEEDYLRNNSTKDRSVAPSPEPIPKPSQTSREVKPDPQDIESDEDSSIGHKS